MCPEWVIQMSMSKRNGKGRIIGQSILEKEANKKILDACRYQENEEIPNKKERPIM